MYDIYMKNYVDTNGVYQTSHEFLVYSVPIVTNKERAFIDPTVSVEMGKAGSFEFSISPKNPYYNSWKQMKTILRVVYDGSTIFRGRVLTISKNDITGVKKIHCEGDLAYLLDSQHTPVKQEKRPVISIFNYLEQLIAGHNDQMLIDGEQDKTYALGEVPGNYTNATPESQRVHTDATLNFGSDSWENTMTALDNLVKQYGGYLRTRYVSEVQIRIDWLDNWFDANPNGTKQTIRVRENLINQDSSSEVNNIFTALIPLGSSQSEEVNIKGYRTDVHGNNNYILVPQIVGLYSDAQLNIGYHTKSDYQNAINNYGVIFKTQKFDNADTQEKLFNYATDFIKENYVGGLTGFTIGAVDMHHVNGSVVKYLVGDRIPVQYPDHDNRTGETPPLITRTVTAIAIKYVLHNPEKNEYSLGIPNNLIQRKYGTNKSKKGSSGGGSKKQQEDEDIRKAMDNDRSEVGVLAWNYVINEKYNNAEYQKLLQEDPNLQYAPTVLKSTKTVIKGVLQNDPRYKETFQTIILDGNTGEVGFMQNPALGEMAKATKSLLINGFSGKISIKELLSSGQQTTPQTLMEMYSDPQKFLNFQIWKKGKLKESQQATLAAMISGEDGTIASIINKLGLDGSGLQATIIQDGLTSMLKFFNPLTASSQNPEQTAEIDGGEGTGKIGKTVNNEWQVKLNDTVTYVDQDGNTQTLNGFVSAKDFNIPEIASFKTKLVVVDNLIANRATIGQLNAQKARIDTLFTDKLSANDLYASIAALDTVSVRALTSARGGISVYSVGTTMFSQGGVDCYLPNALNAVQVVPVGNTGQYKLQYKKFSTDDWTDAGTFDRADGNITGAWSGGVFTVKDSNNVERLSTKIWALLPDSESPVTVTGKVVSRDFRAMYGPDDEHLYSIGRTYPVSMDASDVYDNGWGAVGLNIDTANHKITKTTSATKEVAITAGQGGITWDSTTKRFKCKGVAYAAGTQIAESATESLSNIIKLEFGEFSGSGSSKKRSVTVYNGSDATNVTSEITDYGDGYGAGDSAGRSAMGVGVDGTSIKAIQSATKSIAITAGQGGITWDSDAKRFKCKGVAYAAGTQIAESGTESQSNVIKLEFGAFSGNGSSRKRSVAVYNGSSAMGISSDITDYGDGYGAGYSDGTGYGKGLMGVGVDGSNIKAVQSATKSIAITAGQGGVTWDSDAKRFKCKGVAYAAGSQIAEAANASQSNVIKIDPGTLTGTNNNLKRTVKVQNGSTDILTQEINDYTAGYDANHHSWLVGGSAGTREVIDSGPYRVTWKNKNGGDEYTSTCWEAPGCWLDIVTYDSSAETLGFSTTLALVKTWSTGRRDVVKKWNTPAQPSQRTVSNVYTLTTTAGGPGSVRVKYSLSDGSKGSKQSTAMSQAQWDNF
ncbi:MAG: hypothetical protein J6U54_11555 [Clostridiales bacterium]|nr:hypothetical protein [Clostridiales bacterium]